MGIDAEWGSLPFDMAITHLREKVEIPTQRWADLWGEQHIKAFTVAGATKADLLKGLRSAVDKAIADGESIGEFRKRFDDLVKKHGWSYKGKRGWRTDLIMNTNIRTAYARGRWEQIQRVKARRPYLMYQHGDSRQPRQKHLDWDGLILPVDDPWWDAHYPPNGWGCKCRVRSLSDRDLLRMDRSVDAAPDDGTFTWTDKKTGETREVPSGVDPSWDYNVGKVPDWEPEAESYPAVLSNGIQKTREAAVNYATADERIRLGEAAAQAGARLAAVSVDAVDAAWKRDSAYIAPDGKGAIEGRIESVRAYFETGEPVDAPEIVVHGNGRVGFQDGRHRFHVLREMGKAVLSIAMDPESIERAKQAGLIVEEAP